MTYERFKELWIAAGLNDIPVPANPIAVDEMSPQTIDALVKAANGDFTIFDKVKEIMDKKDVELFCRRTPEETYAYFIKRFEEFK